jgi:type II secretory pathway component PulC
MENRISPEDKLLNVIRGNSPGKAIPVKNDSLNNMFSDFFSVCSWKTRLAVFLEMVLLGLAGIAIVFIIYLLLNKSVAPVDEGRGSRQKENFAVTTAAPLSFYLDAVNKRKLFGGSAAKQAKIAGAEDVNISQIASNFNLSGIIAGDTPKAIIEDKKAQKSYFLKEGESIGEVKLNKIGDGKVILEYRGAGFELAL